MLMSADSNHYNCNHILFSKSSAHILILVHSLKQLVVTVAVVTVCWSYEYYVKVAMVEVVIPVSVKNTPPEKDSLGKIGLQNAKSGAGEQFLPLDCRAEVHLKGVLFSQTPVSHPTLHLPAIQMRVRCCSWSVGLPSALIISIRKISIWGSQILEPMLMFTSKCPLEVQISQGLTHTHTHTHTPATWKHGWSKHGSSIKPSTTELIMLEPFLLQPCFHVAGHTHTHINTHCSAARGLR